MSIVIFYEKPGCANNTRQKRLLEGAGHDVVARNLLTEAWTAERLRTFFGDRPVAEWFNRAAPNVKPQTRHPWRAALASIPSAKSGAVVPERLDPLTALALMLADPLLIRRPLLEADGRCEVGFEPERIHAWLGLGPAADAAVSETCVRLQPCPAPDKL
jgi:arsenate reductase-like glutaredoxin family protein